MADEIVQVLVLNICSSVEFRLLRVARLLWGYASSFPCLAFQERSLKISRLESSAAALCFTCAFFTGLAGFMKLSNELSV